MARRIGVPVWIATAAAAGLLAFAAGQGGAGWLGSPAPRVVDGDTLAIDGSTVRLDGIDAPEAGQSCVDARGEVYDCGASAQAALARLTRSGRVDCAGTGEDRYGRIIAVCRADGRDIGAEMVAQGWALAYRRFSVAYVAEEEAARAAGAGMWAGEFEAPWDHRAAQREARATTLAAAPAGCAIKGNISRNGRLYHLPGARWYDRTGIDERRGERWFCSEEEARAAGWRKAR